MAGREIRGGPFPGPVVSSAFSCRGSDKRGLQLGFNAKVTDLSD